MNTEEREISLTGLFIYIAKGWRNLLIWMLIMAVAMGGIQYVREIKVYKDFQLAQSTESETNEKEKEEEKEKEKEKVILTMEELKEEITDEEKQAVAKVVRLEKEYDRQLDYIESSMFMTMNPYDVSIARLQYWVNTDYTVNYTGITKKDVTGDIVTSYINRLEDNDWREKALKAAKEKTELRYFSEMVGLGNGGSYFTIVIRYPDEKKLQTMIDVLDEEIKSYQSQITKIFGEHKLRNVNKTIEVVVDNDVYNTQQTRKNNLLNLENNIASYKRDFNDNQKSWYAGKILINEEEEEKTEEELLEEEEPIVAPPTPQIRFKNILLGALLGAFLLCMIRAMRYILSDKLKVEDNVDSYLGVVGLGNIQENEIETTGMNKIDRWIESFSKKSYGNLSKDQQIKMTVSNIALYCEKENMRKIYFNSSINCIEEKAGQIINLLKERGISVKTGFSILQDAAAIEEMSKAEGVVFFEQAGQSSYKEVEREIELCRKHDKAIIGMIVMV